MPKFKVPDLLITPRERGYVRGQEGVEQILHAALGILVEEGYRAISFRRIAARCGMSVGNVNYYFRTKEYLVRELLDAVSNSYERSFVAIMHEPGTTPEQRLEEIVTLILEDIGTRKTSCFFPEIWALSNHDPVVSKRMHELYYRARVVLNEIIAEVNPALPLVERETLALFMSASMEGMTVFAGHKKPFRPQISAKEALACKSFVYLVRHLKPGEMSAWQRAPQREPA
jgi:AcrR family transcriptional regulator